MQQAEHADCDEEALKNEPVVAAVCDTKDTNSTKDTTSVCEKPKRLDYDTVVFAGGGTPGIAYAGCMNTLDAAGVVDFFSSKCAPQTYIGTSVGALFAILACCNINPQRSELVALIAGFCRSLQWTAEYVVSHACLGLNDGSRCIAFLDDLLFDKFGSRSMTFGDLQSKVNGRKLVLVATNVADGAPVYFSHTTHPNVQVSVAAFASMCIPLLFEPCVVRYLTSGESVAYTAEAAVRGGALLDHTQSIEEAIPTAATFAAASTTGTKTTTKTTTSGDVGTPLQIQQTFVDGTGRRMEIVDIDSRARIVYAREVQELTCVDGCFCNNNALSVAKEGARVLNLRLKRKTDFIAPKHVSSVPSYVTHLFSLLVGRIDHLSNYHNTNNIDKNNVVESKEKQNTLNNACIVVDVIEIDSGHVAPADFSITEDVVAQILQLGDAAAIVFILNQQQTQRCSKTTQGPKSTCDSTRLSGTDTNTNLNNSSTQHAATATTTQSTTKEKRDAAVDCDRAACSQPVKIVKVSDVQWVDGVVHQQQRTLSTKGSALWHHVKTHHASSLGLDRRRENTKTQDAMISSSTSAARSSSSKHAAASSSFKGGAHDILSHFVADLVVKTTGRRS